VPTLSELAETLRQLHHDAEPLVLPNAWDAATARAVVEAGFPVVATTSSGVSAALGYADGEGTPADEMFAAVRRIARAVDGVPVTADIESGYGLSPEDIVEQLLSAGAVGCNLEDTDHARHALVSAEAHAERVAAVKRLAKQRGVDIVVNARVDVFLRGAGIADPVAEAIRRGHVYLEAGADCVFPIGAPDEASIAALVKELPGPVNVISGFRGAPALDKLRELGVRRISYAGRLHRSMLTDHAERLKAIKSWKEW
jgi:2-methylisocitrate lyase-like PEP mutase family enzyme